MTNEQPKPAALAWSLTRSLANAAGFRSLANAAGFRSLANAAGFRSLANAAGFRSLANAAGFRSLANAAGFRSLANAAGFRSLANAAGFRSLANAAGFRSLANAAGFRSLANAAGFRSLANAAGFRSLANAAGFRSPADTSAFVCCQSDEIPWLAVRRSSASLLTRRVSSVAVFDSSYPKSNGKENQAPPPEVKSLDICSAVTHLTPIAARSQSSARFRASCRCRFLRLIPPCPWRLNKGCRRFALRHLWQSRPVFCWPLSFR